MPGAEPNHGDGLPTGVVAWQEFRGRTVHGAGGRLPLEWLAAGGLVPSSSDTDEEDRILTASVR